MQRFATSWYNNIFSMAAAQPAPAETTRWRLKIKPLKGPTFDVDINSTATIPQLKAEIHNLKYIHPKIQRLIFRGKILKDDQTLSQCDISNGCTLHLVIRKPSGPTSPDNQSSPNSQPNLNDNNPNANNQRPPPNRPPPNVPPEVQRALRSAFEQIQRNRQNGNGPPNGPVIIQCSPHRPVNAMHPNVNMGGRGVVVHRIPRYPKGNNNNGNDNGNNNGNNNDDEEYDSKHNEVSPPMDVKQAQYPSMDHLDSNDANIDHSVNVINWKLKKKRLVRWIRIGPQFGCYYSEEFELNNGSIWRLFLYPRGLNQNGYHQDFVLFIILAEFPYGVDAMDCECTLSFAGCDVDFTFRKHFTIALRSCGWSRGKLSSQNVLSALDQHQNAKGNGKKWVTLSCRLKIHSVAFKGEPCSNLNYIKFKRDHPSSRFALKYHSKPNSTRFRWILDKQQMNRFRSLSFKQTMVSKRFRIGGFVWYIQLHPNGLAQQGSVEPYLHSLKMPPMVSRVEVAFSFYIHETKTGYFCNDTFDGKVGKGWPTGRLMRDWFDWDKMKSLTIDCRVNILSVSVKAEKYFGMEELVENEEKIAAAASPSERKMNEDEVEGRDDSDENPIALAGNDRNDGRDDDDEEKEDPQDVVDQERFGKWLKEVVGLGQYLEMFQKNEIHSLDDVVEYIEEKNHLGEIGIKPFAHKAKLWKAILKLRERQEMEVVDEVQADDSGVGDPTSGSAFEF